MPPNVCSRSHCRNNGVTIHELPDDLLSQLPAIPLPNTDPLRSPSLFLHFAAKLLNRGSVSWTLTDQKWFHVTPFICFLFLQRRKAAERWPDLHQEATKCFYAVPWRAKTICHARVTTPGHFQSKQSFGEKSEFHPSPTTAPECLSPIAVWLNRRNTCMFKASYIQMKKFHREGGLCCAHFLSLLSHKHTQTQCFIQDVALLPQSGVWDVNPGKTVVLYHAPGRGLINASLAFGGELVGRIPQDFQALLSRYTDVWQVICPN